MIDETQLLNIMPDTIVMALVMWMVSHVFKTTKGREKEMRDELNALRDQLKIAEKIPHRLDILSDRLDRIENLLNNITVINISK